MAFQQSQATSLRTAPIRYPRAFLESRFPIESL